MAGLTDLRARFHPGAVDERRELERAERAERLKRLGRLEGTRTVAQIGDKQVWVQKATVAEDEPPVAPYAAPEVFGGFGRSTLTLGLASVAVEQDRELLAYLRQLAEEPVPIQLTVVEQTMTGKAVNTWVFDDAILAQLNFTHGRPTATTSWSFRQYHQI